MLQDGDYQQQGQLLSCPFSSGTEVNQTQVYPAPTSALPGQHLVAKQSFNILQVFQNWPLFHYWVSVFPLNQVLVKTELVCLN